MILAPLRGVTTRCFRETFANEIAEVVFTEAVTPFISITRGVNPLKDRELRGEFAVCSLKFAVGDTGSRGSCSTVSEAQTANCKLQTTNFLTTPQFIGKDPKALREALERIKDAGYATADLNCGCPFPMVRNKGRGSGLLRTPDVLRRMVEVGCEVMGEGAFSIKTRLGIDRPDELLALMPMLNCFPIRRLVVHARTARQMYEGECDRAAFDAIARVAAMPVVYNCDAPLGEVMSDGVISDGVISDGVISDGVKSDEGEKQHSSLITNHSSLMIGRAFVRWLGAREDAGELLDRYVAASLEELGSERPVIGRIKELVAYWREIPRWGRLWPIIKISRSLNELKIW